MSVSRYLYRPDICDGHFCCGDCDQCSPWAFLSEERSAEEEEPDGRPEEDMLP